MAMSIPLYISGMYGLIKVHILFLLSDLFQIEKRLGSYTPNLSTFIKKFQYITQSYYLTFNDVFMIFTNNSLL